MSAAYSRPLTSRDPERLGAHRLLGRLGEGGQGVVYLAETEQGERVAIKLLHESTHTNVLKEVRAARRVASFCTAPILDMGHEDGVPYVITEFIDGPTLQLQVQQRGVPSGPVLYRLAIGTATALAAIHMAGVVHRDFKPGNVLLGPDGPRVIDFGVARTLDATLTATSSIIGTPSYMAPEQLAGATVTPATDVFAWAATIAFAASGRPPYGQDSLPAVMNRIMTGKPDLDGLGGPLRELVSQCLQKDPQRRPHSRDVLLRLLEHSGGPINASQALARGRALATADDQTLANARTARWTTVRLPPTRPVRRRYLYVGAAAVMALVAVMATGSIAAPVAPVAVSAPAAEPLKSSTPESTAKKPARKSVPARPAMPNSPAEIATAIDNAVSARRTASFSAEGALGQGEDVFESKGRFQYNPGAGTNYDVTVRAPSVGLGAGHKERIVLINNKAYYRNNVEREYSAHPDADQRDTPHVWMAVQARWVSSPYNIQALMRNTTSIRRGEDAGTRTFRGTVPCDILAASGPVASFYEFFTGAPSRATYTLVVTRSHLPVRLDINVLTHAGPGTNLHSFYSVTYRNWGASGTITGPN
ncbi:serine/threonine-protein kinase [Actinomadura sp. 9N407]|uniref:serine/threonine-protein kinase n=1 Tax=Actinomadura sp. 9N407 TaxID=3375154 RepID=UPI0037B75F98